MAMPGRVLSLVLFVVLAVWMQVGPVVHQVLGRRTPPLTMAWQMYHSVGIDVCVVDWHGSPPAPPEEGDWRRRYHAPGQVRRAVREQCRAVPEVRVDAWCGTKPEGVWQQVFDAEKSPCVP